MSIRILLADDHKIVREGLRSLLEKESDMKIVAEADNGRLIIQMTEKHIPDVVIMDIAMPDTNGIEATRKIMTKNPNIKIIALSMHSDKRSVIEMLKAGASGYLLKDCAHDELAHAIRTVVSNKVYLSPSITGIVTEEFVAKSSKDATSARTILTPRELEVLQLIAEGHSTKEIAFHLDLSVKTVETYRQKIMGKLDLHSVAELTKYALREGLTSIEF